MLIIDCDYHPGFQQMPSWSTGAIRTLCQLSMTQLFRLSPDYFTAVPTDQKTHCKVDNNQLTLS